MKRNCVVVTGRGAVSPYGVGVDRLIEGLRNRRSTVRTMEDDWTKGVRGTACRLACPVEGEVDIQTIPRKHRRSMGRGALLAQLAATEAVSEAAITEQLLRSGRLGVAIGDTLTAPSSLEDFFSRYLIDRDVSQVAANGFFRVMGHSCAANVAVALGAAGRVLGTPAACAASSLAVVVSAELIRGGVQDVMVCGGAEECHPTTSAIFDILGAASTHFNYSPDSAPAPFDRDRDGTVCGEGAGILVVEAEDHARARGARPLADVLGVAATCDGAQMANPGVESMERCIRLALTDAGLDADDIEYVNAHATGTVQGDEAEAEALARVFGAETPVSGLKGYLGHTLGASGALESIAVLDMIREGYLLPTGKLRNVASECAGIRHVVAVEHRPIAHAVKCSFGFGGINAVLVFGRRIDGSR